MRRGGFTLIELIVVLVVIGIAVGLVAPAVIAPRHDPEPPLASLLRRAQDIAASREETVYLGIAAGGRWRLEAGSTAGGRPLAIGHLPGYRGPGTTLVVSPLGTCGFDVRGSDAARAIPLDPLTCALVAP